MAKLSDYAAMVPDNQELRFLVNAGTATIEAGKAKLLSSNDYYVKVEGRGKILESSFDGSAEINLEDKNPEIRAGPCSFSFDGRRDAEASYRVRSGELIISIMLYGQDRAIILRKSGSETHITLRNVIPFVEEMKGILVPE